MGRKKKAPAAPVGGEGGAQTGAPSARSSQGRGRGRGNAGQGPPASPGSVLGTAMKGPSAERAAVIASPPQVGAPSSIPPAADTVQPSRSASGVAEAGAALAGLALAPGGPRPSEAGTEYVVPESLRHVSLARRPGFGNRGVQCIVKTNYYGAKCNKAFLYQHDVVIQETPSRGGGEVSSKGIRRAVMRQLVALHRASGLNNCLPAFDGNKILFTASELPNNINTFEIVLPEEDGQAGRERRFKVVITATVSGRIDMSRLRASAHVQYEIPQDAINALDTVLRETPTKRDTPIGRSFFRPPAPPLLREAALGAGLEAWRGYYQSVRPTVSGLALNLDLSTTAFYQAVDVLQYLSQAMRWDPSSRAPTDAERIMIKKLLKLVKVEVTHNPNSRRKYRVQDITRTSAEQSMFELEGHGQISVAAYFQTHYGFTLRFPYLPCIVAASNKAQLPLEVCRIQGGQRFPRKLTDDQIRRMLTITKKRPAERESETNQNFAQNNYIGDEYAREFGITISDRMMEVPSRILPPPPLTFRNQIPVTPEKGEWKQERGAHFVEGIVVRSWAVLNFRAVDDWTANQLASNLAIRCNQLGMQMTAQPVLPPRPVSNQDMSDIRQLRRVLERLVSDVNKSPAAQGHSLQLVLCIFPRTDPALYALLKRLSVTEMGFVTQGCLAKHVARPGPVYLGNLALKINVKVASEHEQWRRIGCNFQLAHPATLGLFPRKEPTIIFGADVSHPAPGDDALSIAAVVASQDWPYQGRYRAVVSTQVKHQEMIQNLQDNVREHLISFYRASGVQPPHIVFYRDGVSEGQFMQVLLLELDAIQKACDSLAGPGRYRPQITFVVVQKRHHTRFFPTKNGQKDRSGNVPAGTVVDVGITHPTQFDFFLNSHAGLLGTSRPTRYIVLYDENGFTADAMQMLSNALCYTYARCTRSVSIVPPVYYAHLAAAQARCFVDPTGSDSGSASASSAATGGSAGRRFGPIPVTPLPGVRQEVSNTMYFC